MDDDDNNDGNERLKYEYDVDGTSVHLLFTIDTITATCLTCLMTTEEWTNEGMKMK
jgi:hypothetical protein